jgi:DNA helicase HerA-like ATPase
MYKWATVTIKSPEGSTAFAGFRLTRVFSSKLYAQLAELGKEATSAVIAASCKDAWIDFAAAYAQIPEPLEFFQVIGNESAWEGPPGVLYAYLVPGQGKDQASAIKAATRNATHLWRLLSGFLDFIEIAPIREEPALERIVGRLWLQHCHEVSRRQEEIRIDQGVVRSPLNLGFGGQAKSGGKETVPHLFPWVPTNDSWWRLLRVMANEPQQAAFVAHVVNVPEPGEGVSGEIGERLIKVEGALHGSLRPDLQNNMSRSLLEALMADLHARLVLTTRPMVAARLFLNSDATPSSELLATIGSSVDDASLDAYDAKNAIQFRGGVCCKKLPKEDVLKAPEPSLQGQLFAPQEAISFLRTPLPGTEEIRGLGLTWARTGAYTGKPGQDVYLGVSTHRGAIHDVALDSEIRAKHAYIVGQTGAGKSNLMLHMILQDIRAGKGLAVLDPHGSLVEDILQRYPDERKDDLVLVDMSDSAYPVGFNVMLLDAKNEFQYRAERDLLIDEILEYLERTYDLKLTGGPMFESYFRTGLALIMGVKPPVKPYYPNLLHLRELYTNDDFLKWRMKEAEKEAPNLVQAVKEAKRVSGEAAWANVSVYITSKLNRFYSDAVLQNMTCQNSILNIRECLEKKKVLLFYLGKGIIGNMAAGLLASQLVSRLWKAALARGVSGAKEAFYLYADEFQLFAGAKFAEMLAEARKFGLGLVVAHQYASQLTDGRGVDNVLDAVLGNVGTTILFRVGPQDSATYAPTFAPTFNDNDLCSLPNYRAYMRSFGSLGPVPFSLDVPPPPEDADPQKAAQLRNICRRKYGRPRSEVEKEIRGSISEEGIAALTKKS